MAQTTNRCTDLHTLPPFSNIRIHGVHGVQDAAGIDDSTCYLLPIGNSFQLARMYPGQPLKHNAQERI